MPTAFATYRHGRIELDSPADWDEGTRLEVRPAKRRREPTASRASPQPAVRDALIQALNDPHACGLPEELWPQTPEEIAVLLQHMEAAEPLELTPEEVRQIEAARADWREQQKRLTRESWPEAEKLFS